MAEFNTDDMITAEETDILQEIMNIAFGRAAADLAEYIDIYVILSVPFIRLLSSAELPQYIKTEIKDYDNVSLVEQNFWGKFKGSAFLIFPSGTGKKLVTLLDGGNDSFESEPINELEKETFREVGNILIGACVGKIADLLGDVITYSPPRVIIKSSQGGMPKNLFGPGNLAIILKTVFEFNEKDVSGFLFIVTSQESFAWMKGALYKFLEQYE